MQQLVVHRTLVEIELMIYYKEPDGKPHVIDQVSVKPGRATFSKCWPVLAAGAHEGVRAPLKPGESRKFTVDIPQTFDAAPDVDPEKFAGHATNVRFAK